MPLVPSFTVEQILGYPSVIRLTDTSTGSDPAISARWIYLAKANSSTLVPQGTTTPYIVWPLLTNTIDLPLLDKDYALSIVISWVNSSGNALYGKGGVFGFTMYNEMFDYQLTQQESGNPLLTNDADFFNVKSRLRTEIDSGNNALSYLDLYGAQQCYDRATQIRTRYPYPI